jgi:hypothetical protein
VANQVTDNRTLVSDGDTATGWEDIGGTAHDVDTEIAYGSYGGSIGLYVTTTRDAVMYNNGTTGLFSSGDHAYLLVNCGIVGLLDSQINGGLTVRVTGATITDWAEFELYGSDVWPTAFDGGWIQIVVDIDELLANPTNTNGTPPTVGNIQRFGVTAITAATMPRMADNFWVGGFYILGANTPGIIVEGRASAGVTDWDFESIAADTGIFDSAMLKPGPGGSYVCRTPIQFGINDTSVHGFTESNTTLLWDTQSVMLDGFYGLSALGNSGGTTRVVFGQKSGTGNASIGQQGGAIQSESGSARWNLDFDDPDLDTIHFYGMTLIGGGTFQLDDPAVEVVSTLYLDCAQAQVANSLQVRNTIVNAATADGTAFMVTDDMGDIAFCAFNFSDGHAVEITSAAVSTQNNVGNTFSGYTDTNDSTDAAIYLSAAGNPNLTISSSDSSDLNTASWRTLGTGTVTIQNNVSVTFSGLVVNTEVRVYRTSDGVELAGVEDSGTSFVASIAAAVGVYYTIHHEQYEHIRVEGFTWPSNTTEIPIQQRFDNNYVNN